MQGTLATLATKGELNAEQDKLIKLKTFDSSYFLGKRGFEDDGLFSVLIFQCFDYLMF